MSADHDRRVLFPQNLVPAGFRIGLQRSDLIEVSYECPRKVVKLRPIICSTSHGALELGKTCFCLSDNCREGEAFAPRQQEPLFPGVTVRIEGTGSLGALNPSHSLGHWSDHQGGA